MIDKCVTPTYTFYKARMMSLNFYNQLALNPSCTSPMRPYLPPLI